MCKNCIDENYSDQVKDNIEYWTMMGKYFGYPDCCIKDFIDRSLKVLQAKVLEDIPPHTKQQMDVSFGTGFVPCDACANKVTRETLSTLIVDRSCKYPFPFDNQ